MYVISSSNVVTNIYCGNLVQKRSER